MASQRADRQITNSGCCTNADFNVLSLGTVVGSRLHVLEKHFPIGTSISGDDSVEVAVSERTT